MPRRRTKPLNEIMPVPQLSSEPAAGEIPLAEGPPTETQNETEPIKRRRRRRKVEEPQTPAIGTTQEDIARCEMALTTTFDILGKVIASRRGGHWQLSSEETASLGKAWTAALVPYLPKIGAAVPWASAIVVTFTVVAPRVEVDRQLKEAEHTGAPVPELVK